MDRREVLRILASAAAIPMLAPLPPTVRLAFGRDLHRRARGQGLRTLTPSQDALVTRIAELVIPETDTPGATTVGVTQFIDMLLTEWYLPADRERLLKGLAAIDVRSREMKGGPFTELAPPDQTAVLEALDVRGAEGSAEDGFATLKDLTVYGYFTSEAVVKDVLRYPIIPGRHDGCIPV
jgi:glucoside 3-dehydrogenase (cytochrome c) hitch-hiker subunit